MERMVIVSSGVTTGIPTPVRGVGIMLTVSMT